MIQYGYTAFHLLFCISLQQSRRIAVAYAQYHRIVVLRPAAGWPVARREQHADRGSAEFEFVSFPMAYHFHSERFSRGHHVFEGRARRQQAYP